MPLVHISLIQGRSKEAKKAIAKEVTESIHKHAGAPKESVTVVFHDIDGDSWAAGGVLFSDRVKK